MLQTFRKESVRSIAYDLLIICIYQTYIHLVYPNLKFYFKLIYGAAMSVVHSNKRLHDLLF